MPPNADSRRGSHLREHLLFLLLLLTLNVFAPPATAQNAPPAPADKSEQQKAAYAALADLLQDDKARAELINHLKQAADDTPTAAPATPEESTPATLSDSLNALAQEGLGTFNQKLGALQKLIDSGPKRVFNPAGFFRALGYFLLTVAVTFALFHLIRRLIAPLYKRMGSWGHNARLQRGPWYKRPPPFSALSPSICWCCCWRWRRATCSPATSTPTAPPFCGCRPCFSAPSR